MEEAAGTALPSSSLIKAELVFTADPARIYLAQE